MAIISIFSGIFCREDSFVGELISGDGVQADQGYGYYFRGFPCVGDTP